MQVKTKAIVLHSVKYGDAQLIVDILTAEVGRVSFVCRMPRTAKGKLKKQFFQPLHLLDLIFDYRPNASLQHIKDVRLLVPLVSIPTDPYKLSISLFLAEFLCHATRGERQSNLLFDYVEHSVLWLDGASRSYANFHLVFMMRLSRFLGFFPNLDDFAPGRCFDLREGVFTDRLPCHADYVAADEAGRIIPLMRMDYQTMHLFRMSREERNRCTEWILHYYRLHVPQFPELRSLSVLQELFA